MAVVTGVRHAMAATEACHTAAQGRGQQGAGHRSFNWPTGQRTCKAQLWFTQAPTAPRHHVNIPMIYMYIYAYTYAYSHMHLSFERGVCRFASINNICNKQTQPLRCCWWWCCCCCPWIMRWTLVTRNGPAGGSVPCESGPQTHHLLCLIAAAMAIYA